MSDDAVGQGSGGGAPSEAEAVAAWLGAEAIGVSGQWPWPTVAVARGCLARLARHLRDERGYQLMLSLTVVDRWPAEPRFELVYHFVALPDEVLAGRVLGPGEAPGRRLRIKVPLAGDDAVADSLVAVYAGANWLEREAFDLFGVDFVGHPDLRRIALPEGARGHPLRKDYPLGYEQIAFSHNAPSVHQAKPKAVD